VKQLNVALAVLNVVEGHGVILSTSCWDWLGRLHPTRATVVRQGKVPIDTRWRWHYDSRDNEMRPNGMADFTITGLPDDLRAAVEAAARDKGYGDMIPVCRREIFFYV